MSGRVQKDGQGSALDPLGPSAPAGFGAEPRPSFLHWLPIAVLLVGLIAPVFAVAVPPLMDYPDHLARCYALAFSPTNATLRAMLAIRWSIIPNLAIDLILPPLMHLLPPLVAGQVVIALAAVLPATGALALSRASFGRLSPWSFGAGIVATNAMFLCGMLNFQIAAGIALWGAAAWITLAPRHLRAAIVAAGCAAIAAFLSHLFGYLLLTLLIASAECPGLADALRRRHHLRRPLAAIATLTPPALLYFATPFSRTTAPLTWSSPLTKLALLLDPVPAYSLAASILLALCLIVPPILWASRGRLQVAPAGRLSLPILVIAFLLLPHAAKGGSWIDARLPVLAALTACATLHPSLSRRQLALTAAALVTLFTLRAAAIAWIWTGAQPDITAIRQVLQSVRPGSRVLVLDGNPHQRPPPGAPLPRYRSGWHPFGTPYLHDGSFALIDRQAYPSDLFALPGQQPIVPRPAYATAGDGGRERPPNAQTLDHPPTARTPSFMLDWNHHFDDVLILGAEGVPDLAALSPHMRLLARSGTAALLEVTADGSPHAIDGFASVPIAASVVSCRRSPRRLPCAGS